MSEKKARPSFAPSGLNWLWVLACGVFVGGMKAYFLRRFDVTEFLASVVTVVMLATLAGWIVWFVWLVVGRHRQLAARIAFAFVGLFFALWQLKHLLPAMSMRSAAAAFDRAKVEYVASGDAVMADASLTTAQLPARYAQLDRIFDALDPAYLADGNVMAERRFAVHSMRRNIAFAAAMADFSRADVANFTGLDREGELAKRRNACKAYLDALDAYGRAVDRTTDLLRRELADVPLSTAHKESLLAKQKATADQHWPAAKKVLAASRAYGVATLAVLDHLDATRAHWTIDKAADIVFSDDDAMARFQHLAETADQAAAAMRGATKEGAASLTRG